MAWEYVTDPSSYWSDTDYVAPYIADYLGFGYVDDDYVSDDLWSGIAEPTGSWS